jgi:GNAT superfamily N-acetyltransferase
MLVRAAGVGDYDAYTRLFAELGIPDPLPGPERYTTALMSQMNVACEGDAVLGYITWRPYGPVAHVVQVAVDRDHRGKRIGQQLLEHVRGEVRAAGCTRWYLNVKRDNTSARRLYERCGFELELESFVFKLAWAKLAATRAEPSLRDTLATPADDAAIAARFPIPVERLAWLRGRGSVIVLVRDAEDAIVAVAPFDRSYPGAPAVFAQRPELAHALLEAIRRHADPAFDFVRLTIERDRVLADAIRALGAETTFELLRLSAPV